MINVNSKNSIIAFSSKKDYFSDNMFRRQFIPAIIAAIGQGFADMADSIVLGQSMGVTGLDAICLVMPVFMIINVIMHGFGAGGCIVYSNLKAEGKNDDARRSFQGVISISLIIGILLAIFGNIFLPTIVQFLGASKDNYLLYNATATYARITISFTPVFFITYILYYYLRNDNKEKLANYIFTIGNIIDIVLNIVFVLILRMNVTGAALSTALGISTVALMYLYLVISNKTVISFKKFKPDFKNAFRCFYLGFSSSISYLFSFIFFIIANNVLIRISGAEGVAILDVIQNTSFMVLYIFDAINKSIQPIISTYYGEKNEEGCLNILHFANKMAFTIGLVLMGFIIIFPNIIGALFGLDFSSSLVEGKIALRIFSLGLIFLGINSILENYFQSCMKERDAYLISFLRTFVILIPMLFICSLFGINGIWYMYPITEFLTLLIIFILDKLDKLEKNNFDSDRVFKKQFTNSFTELGPLFNELDEFVDKFNASVSQSYLVKLAVEELSNLVMLRAFSEKGGFVQITVLATSDNSFELHFRDSAAQFNLFELEAKQANEIDSDIDLMGILMVKKKAKEFNYRNFLGFNSYIVKI